MFIRELDPTAENEIALVAQRMRDTLIEVEGPEAGTALYSMEWLVQRVRWHLDSANTCAKIFLAQDEDGQILGHTIVRREYDDQGLAYGLFSTTYVIPVARKAGVAQELLLSGECWMQTLALPASATWTSSTNHKLIHLYRKHGYAQTMQHVHETTGTVMVKLEKFF